MRLQALRDDGVGDGDVGHLAVDRKGLVAAPRDGDVVEDHVVAVGDGDGVLARVAALAHADADVAHDGVVGVAPAEAVAVDGDAAAGRRLAGDVDVLGHDDARADLDDAADVEDDDAVGLGDGIAQGAGAGVAVGDRVSRGTEGLIGEGGADAL